MAVVVAVLVAALSTGALLFSLLAFWVAIAGDAPPPKNAGEAARLVDRRNGAVSRAAMWLAVSSALLAGGGLALRRKRPIMTTRAEGVSTAWDNAAFALAVVVLVAVGFAGAAWLFVSGRAP